MSNEPFSPEVSMKLIQSVIERAKTNFSRFIGWILAVASIWFSFDYRNLFAAGAIIFNDIIPGHLIRQSEITQPEGKTRLI